MTATGVQSWSTTASDNATADSAAPFPEGMAPSQVNDSARGLMASVAMFRDDISGVLVTSGTSTAYAVSSNQGFGSLAALDGKVIAFTPHTTNGAGATLSVDGLADKPLRVAAGVSIQSNVLLEGTPYVALYSNANSEFVLQGMTANPYGIPLAGGLDYWGSTTPGSAFAFPTGQAVSRTTYADLFALVGTTYGSGDGTTTFNLPDKTERVSVMKAATATRLTSAYFGGNSTALGAVGGGESHTLTKAELPTDKPTGTITNGAITITNNGATLGASSTTGVQGGGTFSGLWTPVGISLSASQASSSFVGDALGSGNAHAIVQPTIVCNYIMRII